MRHAIIAFGLGLACAVCVCRSRAGEAPAVETLSDAELYVRARTAQLEQEKTAAIAKAREDIERRVTLSYQAKLAVLKRELIMERAQVADLEQRLAGVMAILKSGNATAAIAPAPERWGSPVFADDFPGPEISDSWATNDLGQGGNSFKIADGMLTGKEKIVTAQTFSGKALRAEYDCWTLSDTPCDASLYLGNQADGFRFFAGVGGEMNKRSCIQINGEDVVGKPGPVLVKGRRQHVVVELGAGKARIEVDGKELAGYEGEKAPAELKDVAMALYTWTPGMHFDNVKVYVMK